MESGDIVHDYKKRFKKIVKYYERSLEDFNADDIHNFRVEMKKLRAFIRFINSAQPVHEQKIPRSIKKLYNLAGNIRNLQLHRQIVINLCSDLKLETPKSYLQSLREDDKLSEKLARQIAGYISFRQFVKKLIDTVPDELTSDDVRAYLQKNAERLNSLLLVPFYYDETLHDVRKVLKDLMYNYAYLETDVNNHIPAALSNIKTMEALTIALGDFHDLCVALFLLSPAFIAQIETLDEIEVLDKLKAWLQSRKDAMSDEIIAMLSLARLQIQSDKKIIQTYELL